jgi:hypothetical protein
MSNSRQTFAPESPSMDLMTAQAPASATVQALASTTAQAPATTAAAPATTAAAPATTARPLAISSDVLSQLRVRDDAGHSPVPAVDEAGGSPLRCCLRPVRPGELVALVSYAPLRRWARETGVDPGPYDEVGPVFIHPEPCAGPGPDKYPADLMGSRRVFRAYSADGRIRRGRLVEPAEVRDAASAGAVLAEMFADRDVALVHARAVEFGCFIFEVRRS